MTTKRKAKKRIDWSRQMIEWACTKKGEEKIKCANKKANKAIGDLKKSLVVKHEMLHSAFNL